MTITNRRREDLEDELAIVALGAQGDVHTGSRGTCTLVVVVVVGDVGMRAAEQGRTWKTNLRSQTEPVGSVQKPGFWAGLSAVSSFNTQMQPHSDIRRLEPRIQAARARVS